MANSNDTMKPIVFERFYTDMKEHDASDQAGCKHWRIRVHNLLTNAASALAPFLIRRSSK